MNAFLSKNGKPLFNAVLLLLLVLLLTEQTEAFNAKVWVETTNGYKIREFFLRSPDAEMVLKVSDFSEADAPADIMAYAVRIADENLDAVAAPQKISIGAFSVTANVAANEVKQATFSLPSPGVYKIFVEAITPRAAPAPEGDDAYAETDEWDEETTTTIFWKEDALNYLFDGSIIVDDSRSTTDYVNGKKTETPAVEAYLNARRGKLEQMFYGSRAAEVSRLATELDAYGERTDTTSLFGPTIRNGGVIKPEALPETDDYGDAVRSTYAVSNVESTDLSVLREYLRLQSNLAKEALRGLGEQLELSSSETNDAVNTIDEQRIKTLENAEMRQKIADYASRELGFLLTQSAHCARSSSFWSKSIADLFINKNDEKILAASEVQFNCKTLKREDKRTLVQEYKKFLLAELGGEAQTNGELNLELTEVFGDYERFKAYLLKEKADAQEITLNRQLWMQASTILTEEIESGKRPWEQYWEMQHPWRGTTWQTAGMGFERLSFEDAAKKTTAPEKVRARCLYYAGLTDRQKQEMRDYFATQGFIDGSTSYVLGSNELQNAFDSADQYCAALFRLETLYKALEAAAVNANPHTSNDDVFARAAREGKFSAENEVTVLDSLLDQANGVYAYDDSLDIEPLLCALGKTPASGSCLVEAQIAYYKAKKVEKQNNDCWRTSTSVAAITVVLAAVVVVAGSTLAPGSTGAVIATAINIVGYVGDVITVLSAISAIKTMSQGNPVTTCEKIGLVLGVLTLSFGQMLTAASKTAVALGAVENSRVITGLVKAAKLLSKIDNPLYKLLGAAFKSAGKFAKWLSYKIWARVFSFLGVIQKTIKKNDALNSLLAGKVANARTAVATQFRKAYNAYKGIVASGDAASSVAKNAKQQVSARVTRRLVQGRAKADIEAFRQKQVKDINELLAKRPDAMLLREDMTDAQLAQVIERLDSEMIYAEGKALDALKAQREAAGKLQELRFKKTVAEDFLVPTKTPKALTRRFMGRVKSFVQEYGGRQALYDKLNPEVRVRFDKALKELNDDWSAWKKLCPSCTDLASSMDDITDVLYYQHYTTLGTAAATHDLTHVLDDLEKAMGALGKNPTAKERISVKIASLIHDLGYSHDGLLGDLSVVKLHPELSAMIGSEVLASRLYRALGDPEVYETIMNTVLNHQKGALILDGTLASKVSIALFIADDLPLPRLTEVFDDPSALDVLFKMKQKGVSTALREELKAAIKTRMEAKCGGPCPDRLIELFAEAANTADGNSLDFSISTLLFKNSGVTDISHATGRMAITLDLDGAAYRKLLEIGLAEATSKKLSGASAVAHAKRYALMKLEKFVATLIDDRKVAARRITLIDETGELGLTGTALQKPQPVTAEQLFAPDGVFARTGKKVLKEKQIIGGCEGCSNAEMSVRIIQSNAPSSSGSLLACCNTP